ncbi:glycosyltransferase [Cryobacterium tepidiphilum]|uniref:Glycosyltransferase n=1 Tax=Cryobacterium tepidiphilum TaxID=2486026 RepID=A0A3M8LAS5_9MICO|nr:glycosyltransferase [Cryobacterium tepidiphilum]RNE62601.1 glycosyltransferase [Cryobacterium tepidiphilum]
MKVLHVAASFARRDGGPSEVIRGLLPALRDLGVETELFTTNKGVTESDGDLASDESVTIFPSRRPHSWTYSPNMRPALTKAVENADIVHVHSFQTYTSSIAMRAALKAGVPYVIQPHGALDSYHWRQRRWKKEAYLAGVDGRAVKGLSGAIYSSSREQEDAKQVLPHVRAFNVPLGVTSELFHLERDPAEQQILFLGRVTPKKRLDLVIRALNQPPLQDLNVSLLVAGPIDPRLGYSPVALAREQGVADRVVFLGQVDNATRAHLLSRASVFTLPSEDESFGVAVAEALAAGCPVVASREVGIAPEAASKGALRLAALDAADLSQVISALLSEADASRQLGERGRSFASDRYTWAASADSTLECYEQVKGS